MHYLVSIFKWNAAKAFRIQRPERPDVLIPSLRLDAYRGRGGHSGSTGLSPWSSSGLRVCPSRGRPSTDGETHHDPSAPPPDLRQSREALLQHQAGRTRSHAQTLPGTSGGKCLILDLIGPSNRGDTPLLHTIGWRIIHKSRENNGRLSLSWHITILQDILRQIQFVSYSWGWKITKKWSIKYTILSNFFFILVN